MAFLHAHMFVTCLIKCRLVVTVPAHWPGQAPAKIEQGPGWPFCWPYRNVRNVDFFRYVNVHRKTNSRKPQDKIITAFLPKVLFLIWNIIVNSCFFKKINLIFYFIIVYYSIFRGTKNRGSMNPFNILIDPVHGPVPRRGSMDWGQCFVLSRRGQTS